ncbi:MAG: hypothetical protein Q9162_000148 [Coniocarpon cinnabarinum]
MESASTNNLKTDIETLSLGFEALFSTVSALLLAHEALEQKLRTTTEECEQLRRLCPESQVESISSTAHSRSRDPFETSREQDVLVGIEQYVASENDLDLIKKAMELQKASLRRHRADIHAKRAPTGNQSVPQRCPFAAAGGKVPADHPRVLQTRDLDDGKIEIETDVGEVTVATRSKRASFHDPLETASHQAPDVQSEVASNTSGPACPIRFLDQHSPEDIAKYFEEHKHELPRSHEVCVKRFQANAESIRELDAKYGNLVAMIQGLGHKHQPMLHVNPDSEPAAAPATVSGRQSQIEDWAKAVSDQGAGDVNALESRIGRFDRPLKDVRVGESPSRPWGVPIPSKYLDAADAVLEKDGKDIEEGTGAQPSPNIAVPPPAAEPRKASTPDHLELKAAQESNEVLNGTEALHGVRSVIVNHGSVFVGQKGIMKGIELVNHGKLFLGVEIDRDGMGRLKG